MTTSSRWNIYSLLILHMLLHNWCLIKSNHRHDFWMNSRTCTAVRTFSRMICSTENTNMTGLWRVHELITSPFKAHLIHSKENISFKKQQKLTRNHTDCTLGALVLLWPLEVTVSVFHFVLGLLLLSLGFLFPFVMIAFSLSLSVCTCLCVWVSSPWLSCHF